ncbi:hypothetical protein ABPG75_000599 [Micractinium tetrahymenae]
MSSNLATAERDFLLTGGGAVRRLLGPLLQAALDRAVEHKCWLATTDLALQMAWLECEQLHRTALRRLVPPRRAQSQQQRRRLEALQAAEVAAMVDRAEAALAQAGEHKRCVKRWVPPFILQRLHAEDERYARLLRDRAAAVQGQGGLQLRVVRGQPHDLHS